MNTVFNSVALRNRVVPSCLPMSIEITTEQWMLDSGASIHFTFDMNDFVEYEALSSPMIAHTATTKTNIIGSGTVILVLNERAIRISPVYYVPEMTCRLLSMGTFLQDGMTVEGNPKNIKILRDGKKFITFYPRDNFSTIYTANVYMGKGLHPVLGLIHRVDFEVIHHRLAHPSNDVLQTASKYVKDFPSKIEIPEDHVCPGCAQGKMTNKSFPSSQTRATKPFQLIHSDLKSFPIESYRKYKYAIVFLNDYTSTAWTMNLCTKDAALPVTKRFIAMVETQYHEKIKGWMSDAGGEYKSKAFLEMLHDRGIKILQSIPHVHQQNGRAERIIRTLMEKAESMRLQACLPQSWWEFTLDHATHVYNLTPM